MSIKISPPSWPGPAATTLPEASPMMFLGMSHSRTLSSSSPVFTLFFYQRHKVCTSFFNVWRLLPLTISPPHPPFVTVIDSPWRVTTACPWLVGCLSKTMTMYVQLVCWVDSIQVGGHTYGSMHFPQAATNKPPMSVSRPRMPLVRSEGHRAETAEQRRAA